MFGIGSAQPKTKKQYNMFLVCSTIIVFAILMGAAINAGFAADQFFTPVFTGILYWAAGILALVFGVLLGIGTYGLYQHSEAAIKSAWNLSEPDWLKYTRIGAIIFLNLLFLGIGVAGLLYRMQFVDTRGVYYLILIGIFLEVSTPIFGIATYPMRKKPASLAEAEMYEDFEREHVGELKSTLGGMDMGERHNVFLGIKSRDRGAVRDVIEEEVREQHAAERARRPRPQQPFTVYDEPTTYEEEAPNFRSAPLGKQNGRISQ